MKYIRFKLVFSSPWSLKMLLYTVGNAFTEHGVIGKIFGNSFSFKLQKSFLHQNAVEFNQKYKSDMCNVWMWAGRQKTWENMLIYLKSVFLAMTPSSPTLQYFISKSARRDVGGLTCQSQFHCLHCLCASIIHWLRFPLQLCLPKFFL